MDSGELSAMKIAGYRDAAYSDKIGEYTVLVNPETYSISHDVNINAKSSQGNYVPTTRYNKGNPQTINFKVLFDGTGVIKNNAPSIPGLAILGAATSNIVDDINQFKTLVYKYDSSSHQSPFVQIKWGVLIFNCRLTQLNFNYKLFKPDGTPMRAEADCSFIGVIDEKKLAAIENRLSPDLTHIKTVKQGDTLALLCYREYGDSKYYYQVAAINGLTNFKELVPGTKLIFPPIEK